MTPAGIALVAASILLDLPSALARLFLVAVVAGLAGVLDWRADLVVALIAFGPALRSIGALVLPLPAGPVLRMTTGARKPSGRERMAIGNAFSLLPGVPPPASLLVIDGPDENAWVLGCTLFIERGLLDSPHLAPVLAHEAGHLAAGDGRVALAAWWLPVRSAAWVATRLMGSRTATLPHGAPQPQPANQGSGARLLPDPRFRVLGGLLRLPGIVAGVVALLFAGGLFPMLLRQVWAPYRRSREYAADAFAASLGHGPGLVEALSDWQVLDVAMPWWLRPTHPYVEQRIDRLQHLG